MVWAAAFTLGPLVGGAFTKSVTLRWYFYINLPISGTSFIIIAVTLKLETPKTPILAGIKTIDWAGSLTLVGGLLIFLLRLEFGGTVDPWASATVIYLIVFGIVILEIFIVIERYFARNPIVLVHLYANKSNFAIFVVTLLHGIILTANTHSLPLYCQSVLGASPLLSEVLLLPFAASISVATVGAGIYLKATGRYLNYSYYWPKIILYQIIAGFGIELDFQPPLIALQNNVPAQDNTAATASFGLVRNTSSAIGVVIDSVAFANKINEQKGMLTEASGATTSSLFSGSNAQANILLISTLNSLQQKLVGAAF
ncbi:hypothetical protein MMC27_008823 [Xylographa pallens]|nr:hypothetical protein [Xylographa pallens]